MTKKDCIYQLKSLIDNSKSFINNKQDSEFNEVWEMDIEALEYAIRIMEATPLE